jgi:hypothetical protein
MTEVATRPATTPDALTLAEPAGLELAGRVGNAVGVDEPKMEAPDPKSSGALERCTTHGVDPSLG